jgi:hypothetical protein
LTPAEAPAMRSFGWGAAALLCLAAAVAGWRGHPGLGWTGGALAAGLAAAAWLAPHHLAWLYRPWMRFAAALGWANTTLLLTLVFYLIVTPTGVVMRLLGRDPMQRRRRDGSYWEPAAISREPRHFDKGF